MTDDDAIGEFLRLYQCLFAAAIWLLFDVRCAIKVIFSGLLIFAILAHTFTAMMSCGHTSAAGRIAASRAFDFYDVKFSCHDFTLSGLLRDFQGREIEVSR